MAAMLFQWLWPVVPGRSDTRAGKGRPVLLLENSWHAVVRTRLSPHSVWWSLAMQSNGELADRASLDLGNLEPEAEPVVRRD
jgi:hypothetical protein